jgi:hypothetical protein
VAEGPTGRLHRRVGIRDDDRLDRRLSGRRLTLTNDEAYDLVIGVAAGELDEVEGIAALLAKATEPWRSDTG